MWRRLQLATYFVLGAQALNHAVIQWGGLHAKSPVLATGTMKNSHNAVKRQKLTIRDRSGWISSEKIPHFTLRPDKTIVLDGLGFCVTADGGKPGDSIFVNPCTGGADQSWNLLPSGHGRKSLIQLESTNLCVGASLFGEKGELNAASVELQKCDDTATGSWLFEEALPPPDQDASPPSERSPMLAAGVCGSFGLATMLLSFGVRSWQQQRNALAATSGLGGVPSSMDQGGVSLTMPLAMKQDGARDSLEMSPKFCDAFNGQVAHRLDQGVPRIDNWVGEDGRNVWHFQCSDPHALKEGNEKNKKATEFKLNVGEAVDHLNADIPAIFKSEPYWGIYADDLELDLQMVDPAVLELMGGTPWDMSKHAKIRGLDANKGAYTGLRTFHKRHVDCSEVQVRIRLTYDINGDQIITARWSAKLGMKSMEPVWASRIRADLFGWRHALPQTTEVILDAVSKFHFNADGRICRHVVDTVSFNPPRELLSPAMLLPLPNFSVLGIPLRGAPQGIPQAIPG